MSCSHYPKFVLASQSIHRVRLLEQIGIKPDHIQPANIEEIAKKKETPKQFNQRMAYEKTRYVSDNLSKDFDQKMCFVLAADTIIALGRRTIGKPKDKEHAKTILQMLSGRTHRVYSSVALITPTGKKCQKQVQSRVYFKQLTKQDIDEYIDSRQWLDKSGAYAIQGHAEAFVRKIQGSYSAIVGLPLYETLCLLRGNGFRAKLPLSIK